MMYRYNNHGIIEVAAVTPATVKIGNPVFNTKKINEIIKKISHDNEKGIRQTQIAVFPELCITGYTCGDLFNQHVLINTALRELKNILTASRHPYAPLIFVGLPVRKDNQLFNCAVAVHNGNILGVIPKIHIPNYGEFYEGRYFSSAINRVNDTISIFGADVPFTPNLLIEDEYTGAVISADICEDLWAPIAPSTYHCMSGANIVVNLSASNEVIGKANFRRDLVKIQSAKSKCGYIYSSAGQDESTTDTVFSGHNIIASNGKVVSESKFSDNNEITYGEIDIEQCLNDRTISTSFMTEIGKQQYKHVFYQGFIPVSDTFKSSTEVSLTPFIPKNIDARTKEVIGLQAAGLATRLRKIGCSKAVIGISGGLDSTLALIATVEAFKLNNFDMSGIIGITMPGFGTTKKTLDNSRNLMNELGITSYEISITESCIQHLRDINHDINITDVTYENAQARERTQILMDMANKHGAIVIGTGDLSELALGWCTYNGDHMSMYAVNSGVPKTLVKALVESYANNHPYEAIKNTLLDICNTPVSPELLPPNKDGSIAQKTEDSIGSYLVHDFTMFHMLKNGFGPKKIYDLYINTLCLQAQKEGKYVSAKEKEAILDNMILYYKRFFTQQFKRSCLPDGVKIGNVTLSPRGDWKMPSDASYELWIEDLNYIKEQFK